MSFRRLTPSNHCGNHGHYPLVAEEISQNECQRSRRPVSRFLTPDSSQFVDEYFEESYGEHLHTFRTDRLLTEVIEIEKSLIVSRSGPRSRPPPPVVIGEVPRTERGTRPTLTCPYNPFYRPNTVSHTVLPPHPILPPPVFIENAAPHPRILTSFPPILATPFGSVHCTIEEIKGPRHRACLAIGDKEEAAGSSKDEIERNQNDEEEGACSTLQICRFSLEDSSSDDSPNGAEGSSELDERAGTLELGTILEETEATEHDLEICKFDLSGRRRKGEGRVNKDSPHRKRDTGEAREEQFYAGKPSIGDFAENIAEAQGSLKIESSRSRRRMEILDKYRFEEFNPMAALDHPFDEGMRNLCSGNVSQAALCLEAAVSSKPPIPFPDSAAAWLCLGISQAANEQDILAIIALKKYLNFEPDNLHALIFLTVSYTYENYKNLAIVTLWDWLTKNPKYSNLVKISPPEDMYEVSSPMNLDFHQKILNLFLKAANKVPRGNIDADVQCALGLLYNMINEYAKASDCFKTAVMMDPCDEMLWNHLGEALSNNYRYGESIEAYYNALNLRPKYTRARYNLGVSCSRLGDHKEALQHYLRALTVQAKSSRGLAGRMTDTIWASVKVAVRFLRRLDLEEAVEKRDLVALNKAFGVE